MQRKSDSNLLNCIYKPLKKDQVFNWFDRYNMQTQSPSYANTEAKPADGRIHNRQ
jgi:hypothetical protein